MKKVKHYHRTVTVRLTENEYQSLQKIKKSGNKISDIIRQSITFFENYYSKNKET